MTAIPHSDLTTAEPFPDRALRASRIFWFVIAVLGQWTFVYFIVAFYYTSTLSGNFEAWNSKPLIDGYKDGDGPGNAMFAVHVLLAGVMTLGGTLQFIQALRRRAPTLHRWTGRVYLTTAAVLALGGLWLVWVRGTYLSLIAALAISLDAVLIVALAAMTLRFAVARDIARHQRWALRTFMVANGVWMLRVGIMFWAIATQGAGMTNNMDGPFDVFWIFGCYLLPLAGLELYFRVRDHGAPKAKLAFAGALTALTLAMAVGVVGTYAVMWGPYI